MIKIPQIKNLQMCGAAIIAAVALASTAFGQATPPDLSQSAPASLVASDDRPAEANLAEASLSSSPAAASAAIVLAEPAEPSDPCNKLEVEANATRPEWDYPAATTQCGVFEADSGGISQSMGAGVTQQIPVSSLRYGLTPKLDLRWGITSRIYQYGGPVGNNSSIQGIGDQWIGGRYRFHEQGRVLPAMTWMYQAKIPSANPAKGLGSGFWDHQVLFIASRDLGHYHFDFNTVGTIAGTSNGHEGAAQFGLDVTRPINKKLSWVVEGYGGPQPGTADRFGAGLVAATYTLRPQVVLDAAYARTYTAGSPRQFVAVGITYARRAGFAPLSKRYAAARFLGR